MTNNAKYLLRKISQHLDSDTEGNDEARELLIDVQSYLEGLPESKINKAPELDTDFRRLSDEGYGSVVSFRTTADHLLVIFVSGQYGNSTRTVTTLSTEDTIRLRDWLTEKINKWEKRKAPS